MKTQIVILVSTALLFSEVDAAEQTTPKREPIYNEDGKGIERVEQALMSAKRENKRVLLKIGGNWCGWCYKLGDLFHQDREIEAILRDEYELVLIDSRTDKPVIEKWQITPNGYPYLAVLDSAGRKVTEQETGSLEIGDKHDPNKVKTFLEAWKPAPLDANDVFAAALAQATREDKRVFFRVGAPWCGWCRRLDAFLVRPQIETILKKDYIVVKIDQQRMIGATEVIQKIRKPAEGGGIPWFAFLDGDGRILITSTKPGTGNIGFPADPNTESPYFLHMLKTTRSKITDADIELIAAELAKPAGT
jgi:thioredoxin-related protein